MIYRDSYLVKNIEKDFKTIDCVYK